jgi:hypothetical protein
MSQENASNKPLIRYVNRQQMGWRAVDVERLIGEDHPERAIWTLVGALGLEPVLSKHREQRGRRRAASIRSATADQFVGVRLQPGDWFGAGSGATL